MATARAAFPLAHLPRDRETGLFKRATATTWYCQPINRGGQLPAFQDMPGYIGIFGNFQAILVFDRKYSTANLESTTWVEFFKCNGRTLQLLPEITKRGTIVFFLSFGS